MMPGLPRRLRDQLVLSALNWKYGPEGWRVFASDRGRLWATTTTAKRRDQYGMVWTGLPDAVDADTPAELAAKLTARSLHKYS